MRGKKIDTQFVGNFVAECAMSGRSSTEEIATLAKEQIAILSKKIEEAERLKKLRSKLLDVLISLNQMPKKDKSKDRALYA